MPVGASPATSRAPSVDVFLCSYAWLNPVFTCYLYQRLIHSSLAAMPPDYGIDLVALARHARAARRHRATVIGLVFVDGLIMLLGVAAVLTIGFRRGHGADAVLDALVIVVVTTVVYVAVAGWHLLVVRSRAVRTLCDPGDPRDKAPPLRPEVEQRLARNSQANVVVFAGGIPFVGAGALLGRFTVDVDVTRAGVDGGGAPRTVTELSAQDVQKALSIAVRGTGIDGLEVHNRLFVAGAYTDTVPGLLPDPMAAPEPVIAPRVIRQAIDNPSDEARTYLCIQKTGVAGELVVNIFLRVVRFHTYLHVEFHAYVLLPLNAVVRAAAEIPLTAGARLVAVARTVLPVSLRLLRGAPRVAWALARWRWGLARQVPRQRARVRRSQYFNYGASGGVRAVVAAEQRERLFRYEDEEIYVQSLRRRILDVIVEVVEAHGIDSSELKKQRMNIYNTTYRIGDVKGRNVMIGDWNQLTAFDPGRLADDDDEPESDTGGGRRS